MQAYPELLDLWEGDGRPRSSWPLKPERRLSPEVEAQYRKAAQEIFRQHGPGVYIASQFHVVIQDELRKLKGV